MDQYSVDNVTDYDLEVYPGYFLAGFLTPDGTVRQFEIIGSDDSQSAALVEFINSPGTNLAGFNSNGYDDLVLTAMLKSEVMTPDIAYRASVDIIVNQIPRWKFDNYINSIDLMPILPGARLSLKKVGVCLGHSKLQELPVRFDKVPSAEEREILREYNKNDLYITRKLREELKADLNLRASMSRQYGVDLRSCGDATIAEKVLIHEYQKVKPEMTKRKLNDLSRAIVDAAPYAKIGVPDWWGTLVQDESLKSLGESIFSKPISIVNGGLLASDVARQVYIDDRYYTMGVGGLHSVDGGGTWRPKPDEVLVDIDVASYYPNLILTQGQYPRAWGEEFLSIFRVIVDTRMKAKRAGDKATANSLKIVANGTYGKTSEEFSSLYDPEMTANVTVRGQLALLTLIDMLCGVGKTCSANTDGITVLCKRDDYDRVKSIVGRWETHTGLEMEYTEYRSLHQANVNNYCAVTTDGKLKAKGRPFLNHWPDLRHMPSANIVSTAVQQYLLDGTAPDKTIRDCQDINQFILTQNVGGSFTTSWNGRQLGKVLRFYKSTSPLANPIIKTPGAQDAGNEGEVAESSGCVPLEDLPPNFPPDVNYQWYVDKAISLIGDIEPPKKPGMNQWAELAHRKGLRPCIVDPDKPYGRARVVYGETDFTSMPDGHILGTGTGDGLIAKVHTSGAIEVYSADKPYPGKTRKLIEENHAFTLIYGGRVPMPPAIVDPQPPVDFDEFYTPAELKKVGR